MFHLAFFVISFSLVLIFVFAKKEKTHIWISGGEEETHGRRWEMGNMLKVYCMKILNLKRMCAD